jgi:hypothetical protein
MTGGRKVLTCWSRILTQVNLIKNMGIAEDSNLRPNVPE